MEETITTEAEEKVSPKRQQKSNVDFTIKISLNSDFDSEVKQFLDKSGITNNVLAGDKAIFALQTLHEADELILKKAINRNEMPKSSIRFEMLTSNGEKIDIPKVEMGRYLFKNADLTKIINVSSNKIVENQISEETQKAFSNLMKKDKDGKFKIGVDLDNVVENGVRSLEGIAESIGDEHVSSFVRNFAAAYGVIGKRANNIQENIINKEKPKEKGQEAKAPEKEEEKTTTTTTKEKPKIPENAIKAIKDEFAKGIVKIPKTETKEKTITKATSLGKGF
jgi:hypothetical protein